MHSKDFQIVRTADGSDTLFISEYSQTCHSKHGALSECLHIYLNSSGARERIQRGMPTRIFEVGFGTGLNFWATADLALKFGTKLEYFSIDKNILETSCLRSLNHSIILPDIAEMRNQFIDSFDKHSDKTPILLQYQNLVSLSLFVEDFGEFKPNFDEVDAVFQDAFSPDANPELWTVEHFRRLYSMQKIGGKLTTYSSKVTVQKAMREAGFVVSKANGPWGKRDILVANRE